MRRRASTRLLFLLQERYKRLQRQGHLLPASIIKTDCCRGCPPVLLQQGSQRRTSTLVSVTIPNIVKITRHLLDFADMTRSVGNNPTVRRYHGARQVRIDRNGVATPRSLHRPVSHDLNSSE